MAFQLPKSDPRHTHLALVAGKNRQEAGQQFDLATPIFYGTAFAVRDGLFLTAAHAYQNARAAGRVALANVAEAPAVFLVEDAEEWQDLDVAFLRCPVPAAALPFCFETLDYFEAVRAVGFPFAVEPELFRFSLRAFQGHVITRRELLRPAGQPAGYEVSFAPPPGLSGAPLLVDRDGRAYVGGIILEHDSVTVETVVTQFGIALDAQELLRETVVSKIVGGTLAERLFERKPLSPRIVTQRRN